MIFLSSRDRWALLISVLILSVVSTIAVAIIIPYVTIHQSLIFLAYSFFSFYGLLFVYSGLRTFFVKETGKEDLENKIKMIEDYIKEYHEW